MKSGEGRMKVQRISALTIRVSDMTRAIAFYNEILGLEVLYGGEHAVFSSLRAGTTKDIILNLEEGQPRKGWGRIIFYVQDVNEFHSQLKASGFNPPLPKNATWGERFFHLEDPDGNELSFAQPLQ
jgi:catechol 2,3-dioxygenase-like lactoylglutathione lyase family enzyme